MDTSFLVQALMSGKSWPNNMYTRNMFAGFREMRRLKKVKFLGGFEGRFERFFGQKPPRQSTHHDQIKNGASLSNLSVMLPLPLSETAP